MRNKFNSLTSYALISLIILLLTPCIFAYTQSTLLPHQIKYHTLQDATPGAIAVDQSNDVYVVYSSEDVVKVYDSNGVDTHKDIIFTDINNNKQEPESIAVDSLGNVWVSYPSAGVVRKYNSTGYVADSDIMYTENTNNLRPGAIAVNYEGYVYVAYPSSYVVKVFNSSGKYEPGADITYTDSNSHAGAPEYIAINHDDEVYVSYPTSGDVVKFSGYYYEGIIAYVNSVYNNPNQYPVYEFSCDHSIPSERYTNYCIDGDSYYDYLIHTSSHYHISTLFYSVYNPYWLNDYPGVIAIYDSQIDTPEKHHVLSKDYLDNYRIFYAYTSRTGDAVPLYSFRDVVGRHLYTIDTDYTHTTIRAIITYPKMFGTFSPKEISVDGSNNLYVHYGIEAIFRFNSSNKFIYDSEVRGTDLFGNPATPGAMSADSNYDLWVSYPVQRVVKKFGQVICGNNVADTGEQCDGTTSTQCTALGFDYGTASCTNTCEYDASKCNYYPSCASSFSLCKGNAPPDCQNLNTDRYNCGSCNNECPVGQGCLNGACQYMPGCNDSVLNPGEWCDQNKFAAGITCEKLGKYLPTNPATTLICGSDCQSVINNGCIPTRCGDGIRQTPNYYGFNEQCDNSTSTEECTANCTSTYCGDGIIQKPNGHGVIEQCESGDDCEKSTCQYKKIPGWNPTTLGTWKISSDKTIVANTSSTSLLTDYPLNLKANTPYNISFRINNPTSCDAYIDLDDGHCFNVSNQKFEETFNACFDNSLTTTDKNVAKNTQGWKLVTQTFTINPKPNVKTIDGYVKQLHLRLVLDNCPADQIINVQFDDISLKDVTYQADNVHYDYMPSVDSTTACCPANGCWDGTQCVDSDLWMSNSQKSPIWNNILNYSVNNWKNKHVNSTNITESVGYRCIANASGFAYWQRAEIRYDWNFENSGYCNVISDCFVNTAFADPNHNGNCIHAGESVNDKNIAGEYSLGGNHYCDNGYWTTRSAIIADVLTKMSLGKPYILLCDNKINSIYSGQQVNIPTNENIAAACTIIFNNSANVEQITTGFVLKQEDELAYNSVLTEITTIYAGSINKQIPPALKINESLAECMPIPGKNYTRCSDEPNIVIYYENMTHFFLVSTKPIESLKAPASGFFTSIWNLILTVFSYTPRAANSEVTNISIINKTSNFERIYVMNNPTITTKGVEESKYDEYEQENMTLLFIEYTGTNQTTNPIYSPYIHDYFNPVYLNIINDTNTQTITIKTKDATGLWPYLTATLRIRGLPNRKDN